MALADDRRTVASWKGRWPSAMEVIDHAGAVQAAVHGGRDEAGKLACHALDDVDVDLHGRF
jgi:hypothetical protein